MISSCSKPEDGAPGTANVIYSDWITGPTLNDETIDGTSGKSALLDTPLLTQDILDKGTILVYAKFSSTVFPLPYTSRAGGVDNTLTFYPMLQKIKVFRFKHDGSGGLGAAVSYRYILIPGGVSATAKNNLNFKQMSYQEVCKHFNLKK
jgi:hypothetical protein